MAARALAAAVVAVLLASAKRVITLRLRPDLIEACRALSKDCRRHMELKLAGAPQVERTVG